MGPNPLTVDYLSVTIFSIISFKIFI